MYIKRLIFFFFLMNHRTYFLFGFVVGFSFCSFFFGSRTLIRVLKILFIEFSFMHKKYIIIANHFLFLFLFGDGQRWWKFLARFRPWTQWGAAWWWWSRELTWYIYFVSSALLFFRLFIYFINPMNDYIFVRFY